MNKKILLKARHYIGLVLGWFFSLIFFMGSIGLFFDEKGNNLGALFSLTAALLLLPPIWSKLNINILWYKQLAIKMVGTLILVSFATAMDPAFDDSSQKPPTNERVAIDIASSKEQKELYYKIISQKIQNTLNGADTDFDQQDWMRALGINGVTSANSILKEFKRNEVAAAKKYDAGWIIGGNITKIDDGFLSTTVGLGGDRFFNLQTEIEDKEKVASYNKGQNIKLFCEKTLEAATFVFSYDCVDYNDWFEGAVKKAEKALYKNDDDFKRKADQYKQTISGLSKYGVCYIDIEAENCKKLFQAIRSEKRSRQY